MFFGYSIKLPQMYFCLAPKVFDAVDVIAGILKPPAVVYAKMPEL
jgi:hypothetical protein